VSRFQKLIPTVTSYIDCKRWNDDTLGSICYEHYTTASCYNQRESLLNSLAQWVLHNMEKKDLFITESVGMPVLASLISIVWEWKM